MACSARIAVSEAKMMPSGFVKEERTSGLMRGDVVAGTQFLIPNRAQPFLLPPALQDWLPENDLSYFVLDAVEQIDLRPLYAACRAEGCQCRKVYDPAMMFALLVFAYCQGARSSRQMRVSISICGNSSSTADR